jgi:two-component system, OmpR family, sensor histidine kinase CpxA
MRSLFVKIFLWFWVTQLLIVLTLVLVWSTQPEVLVGRWRAATSQAVSMYAQSSAEQFDRYGHFALNNYLQRLYSQTGINAALLDINGNLLAGAPKRELLGMAQVAPESHKPEFVLHGTNAMSAMRVDGPSQRTYIFVAELPRGPFSAFWMSLGGSVFRWGVAVLISGIICYLLARYLTGPILRLRTASRQIATGDLTARAAPEMQLRGDEIGDLVQDFNVMADRMETLLTTQSQLIRDISHELRSPLARLNVALELARQRAGAEAAPALDRIEQEAARLNEMIGRLLTLARLESVSEPPDRTHIDLRELLADITDDAHFEAQQRGCNVRLEAADTYAIDGNRELLRSAVENVVRNAIRYTAEGSDIEVQLSEGEIRVRDHGPGVPEAELQNLFRPFYRVANARERKTGGTGLGLAITERAVRLHGGSVEARNAPEGGLIVHIHLPAASAASNATRMQQVVPAPTSASH